VIFSPKINANVGICRGTGISKGSEKEHFVKYYNKMNFCLVWLATLVFTLPIFNKKYREMNG
jgi:hypothetical protein